MADLKSLSVAALRELAKKHVGRGYSRLKTRSQLVAALARILPQRLDQALGALSAVTRGRLELRHQSAASAKGPKGKKDGAAPAPAALVAEASAKNVASSRTEAGVGAPMKVEPPPERASPRPEAPHDPDELFLARVGGHPPELKKDPVAARAEQLPGPALPIEVVWDRRLGSELPRSYDEDTMVLLPRDPHTAYLFWDFSKATRAAAFGNDLMPRYPKLLLYEGGHLVRELDFSLDGGSWWFQELMPGHSYRAEIVVYGPNGRHRMGPASNGVRLPNMGPSVVVDDRFGFIPFDVPLQRFPDVVGSGAFHAAPGRIASEVREHLYQLSGGGPRFPLGFDGADQGEEFRQPLVQQEPQPPPPPGATLPPGFDDGAGLAQPEGQAAEQHEYLVNLGGSEQIRRSFGPNGLPLMRGAPPHRPTAELASGSGRRGGGRLSASAPWSGTLVGLRERK